MLATFAKHYGLKELKLSRFVKLLKAELTKNPEIGLHLYADQTVVYAKVAEVMAAAQHAGIVTLAFVTVEQSSK